MMGVETSVMPSGLLAMIERQGLTLAGGHPWRSVTFAGYRIRVEGHHCPPAAEWPYDAGHRLLVAEVEQTSAGVWSMLIVDEATR